MLNATWKTVKNGKTTVTVNVGKTDEKRFSLAGVALTATDVVALCEGATELVRVRSRSQHDGADANKTGGLRHSVRGEQNGITLATEIRQALGMATDAKTTDATAKTGRKTTAKTTDATDATPANRIADVLASSANGNGHATATAK